ncbi:ty3-gypsy retrotransposon protein [Cucumis melo var. makuwa]|uniref:Ty3-gypsy retrotransposon protein n=1 Tax=Cucumis melo var. makuwa TaxID=1194695 RepID=A0A5D3BLS7_CUCMM|nr:ty3-gypsy retrotransposon protein [Cucumis melo var. makuwa]
MQQGMLRYKDQLVISKKSALLPNILHTHHDSVFGGHSRYLRTYKRLTGELYWEGRKTDVQKYYEECLVCQCNKTLALSTAGLLMPLEVPDTIWSKITMDFIDGLPKSAGFEKSCLSSSIEWTNRSGEEGVEAYLRCFCCLWPATPSPLIYYGDMGTPNSTLDQQLKERGVILGALKEHLRIAQEKMKNYADKKRTHVEFQEGEMVFLKIRPHRQVSLRKKRNGKLSSKFFGPFKKVLGNHASDAHQLNPFLNENLEWMTKPAEIFGYRKKDSTKDWEGIPPHKTTWENFDDCFLISTLRTR